MTINMFSRLSSTNNDVLFCNIKTIPQILQDRAIELEYYSVHQERLATSRLSPFLKIAKLKRRLCELS